MKYFLSSLRRLKNLIVKKAKLFAQGRTVRAKAMNLMSLLWKDIRKKKKKQEASKNKHGICVETFLRHHSLSASFRGLVN